MFKQAFTVITGEQTFALANPGQKYQVTDVIHEPGLPFRRLLFAGAKDNEWFIHYEHGGIGHGYSVVVFTIDSQNRLHFLWGGAGCEGAKELEDLRKMIATGRFSDDAVFYW